MRTIKILADCEYEKGDIVEVENNEAHRLIDAGFAKLLITNTQMKGIKSK
jgi:mannose-6-phosphate isomerase-like protein (cupin superfamily)